MEDLWETTWADTDINNSGFRVCASLPWHRQRWTIGLPTPIYLPSGVIIDSNGNLQQVFTAGTSGGSTPTCGKSLVGDSRPRGLKPSLILRDLRDAEAPLYRSAASFNEFFRSLLGLSAEVEPRSVQ